MRPPAGTTDLIICSRVADRPDPSVLRVGADPLHRVCQDCGAPTWYSRDTILAGDRPYVICEPCATGYGYAFIKTGEYE
jgi:hypothetical protein